MQMATTGTEGLVNAATAAGARHLVYLSSAHVYGPMVGTIDERSPPNPVSNYAIAHFAAEQIFRRHVSTGSRVLALRPCAVFGRVRAVDTFRRWSLIPYSFPWEAIRKGRIVIRSTGEQRRNFVGTGDIAALVETWLTSGDAGGWQIVNPLGRLSCTVREFALLCAKLSEEITGRRCEVERVTPTGPTAGDDFNYQSISSLPRGDQRPEAFLLSLMRELAEVEAK
jgi:UDP-glucose 4-epimerase